jgi:hypothetical protein
VVNTRYDIDLDRNPANYQPLTSLTIKRTALAVWVSDGGQQWMR